MCRARLREESTCSRCGSDLSVPLRIAARADVLERQAIQQLAAGAFEAAETVAAKALQLRRSPLSRALSRFIAHLKVDQ